VPPDRVLKFTELYSRNCAGCHGAEGKLGPAPPLNDSLFRAIVPIEVLKDVVTSGRLHTPMPAWARENGGPLTAAQIQVLVCEIKGIPYTIPEDREGDSTRVEVVPDPKGRAPHWGMPGPPPEGVPSYLAPKGRQGPGKREQPAGAKVEELRVRPQVEQGPHERDRKANEVFARACAGCHGPNGNGEKPVHGKYLAIHDPAFLSLISDQALRRTVITGRPDLAMPTYAEKEGRPPDFKPLTSEEVSDLVALLASWRQEGSVNGK
jgi:cytochrome c oxidase cbb3-type subunit 3/ubiquinol-cytochrome c reductase cytochrome c subunit